MPWELADCERLLLEEIADPRSRKRDVAQTYALALRSSERGLVDWARVNHAVVARWSLAALADIKRDAHSGRCFTPP